VTLLLGRASGQGTATPDERMQAAEMLRTVGLLKPDNTPGDVTAWAKERNLNRVGGWHGSTEHVGEARYPDPHATGP